MNFVTQKCLKMSVVNISIQKWQIGSAEEPLDQIAYIFVFNKYRTVAAWVSNGLPTKC